jgi:hypothetical protein
METSYFGNGLRARFNSSDIELHRRIWRFIEEVSRRSTFGIKPCSMSGAGTDTGVFTPSGAVPKVSWLRTISLRSGREGLLLAKELLGSRVQTKTRTSVYELGSLGQTFDIILLLGVYSHLLDPLDAFAQLRHCCHIRGRRCTLKETKALACRRMRRSSI